jgi:putative nucleotidyltransferase with HDIG domain
MDLARADARHQADSLSAGRLMDAQRDLALTALRRVRPAERTVAGEIVIKRFIERFAGAQASGDWTPLFAWLDATAQRYVGILAVPGLIDAALAVLEAQAAVGRTVPDWRHVRGEIERLAGKPRLVREPLHHDAIDETDIAIDDLMTRLDRSDVLTAEHSRAVSSWCTRLGKKLGLAKHDVVHLTRCGLVHDIGKVTTPSAILNAPRGLREDEMTIMRHHAEAGAAIVVGIPLLAHLLSAVRNHHERFDGDGYPDRLRAGGIPQAARIVCVADAFNAMIGRRPYRPPLAPSIALERLRETRGSQFDPLVVDAMIDVVSNRP